MTPTRLDVWPPLSPQVYLHRPPARLPFPLAEPACRLFERARHGLWQGMRALGLGPDAEILVPAYHHGSEIEALVRAGLICRFYEGTETLEPDADELETLLDPRVRALYLIHYLGFPQDAPRWRAWCDERGLLLIEDAAQAWLASIDGRPVGSFGDLSIFCLYKTFGLPDGSALLSPAPRAGPPPRRPGVPRAARGPAGSVSITSSGSGRGPGGSPGWARAPDTRRPRRRLSRGRASCSVTPTARPRRPHSFCSRAWPI